MHSYHLKDIILAEAKMHYKFSIHILHVICGKVPRLMAESKESRLMHAYRYSITQNSWYVLCCVDIVHTIESYINLSEFSYLTGAQCIPTGGSGLTHLVVSDNVEHDIPVTSSRVMVVTQ